MLNMEEGLSLLPPTHENLAALDVGDSLWRRMRTGARQIKHARMEKERRLNYLLKQSIPSIPWSVEAANQVAVIKDCILKSYDDGRHMIRCIHSFEFAVDCFLDDLNTDHTDSERRWDMLLVTFFFILAVQMTNCKTHFSDRKRKMYRERWPVIYDELIERLSREDEDWSKVLSDKLVQLYFTAHWNNASEAARTGTEMQDYIEKTEIREALRGYNSRAPRVAWAPLMELNIASRRRERTEYPEILLRLQKADPKFRFKSNLLSYPERGKPDLVDFKDWVKNGHADLYLDHREKPLGKPMQQIRKAAAASIVLLGVAIGGQTDIFTTGSGLQTADIRPNLIEPVASKLAGIRANLITSKSASTSMA